MSYIKYLFYMIRLLSSYFIGKIIQLNKNFQDIWLLSERSNEAEDNSYFLFKYIRENYPNKKVYYVIDYDSTAYQKIKNYGNLINHNSFKHYIYYFMSKTHISAFQFFGVPDDPLIWRLESWGFFKKKRVFLQHGITKEMLPFLMYENTSYNLFICGAQPEYEYIKRNFGYPEENVKYVGFCRFDNLHKFSMKKQILIMPTWRQWIGMTSKRQISNKDRERFLSTEYYQTYQSLLNNKELQNFLQEESIQLLFYPHPEMQKYINLFKCNSPYVEIIDRNQSNLQGLMSESLLLITDYSSIAFDRAYMRKPLIYYQFDKEDYYKNHFEKGYFDADLNGFGPVVESESILVKVLIDICRNGQKEEKYVERSKLFFPLYDNKNCQRTYEEINNL